jgi:hypothetical protein
MPKKMTGFRVFHGAAYEPWIALAAERCDMSRAEVFTLWMALQDHASQADPRGTVQDFDIDAVSIALNIPQEKSANLLSFWRERGTITPDHVLKNWMKKQHHSTDRIRAFRARRAEQQPGKAPKKMDPDSPAAVAARRQRLMPQTASTTPENRRF